MSDEAKKFCDADTEEVNDICKRYTCIKASEPVVPQYYSDLAGCL